MSNFLNRLSPHPAGLNISKIRPILSPDYLPKKGRLGGKWIAYDPLKFWRNRGQSAIVWRAPFRTMIADKGAHF